MFGMGGSEILVILIVALLFLGPDKLPEAAKKISKGIRDIKKQSRVLQQTIEDDENIGGAIRELKSALRGEEAPVRPKPIKPANVERPEQAALPEAAAPEHAIHPHLTGDGIADGSHADHAGAPVIQGSLAEAATVTAAAAAADDQPRLTLPPTVGEADPDAPHASADDHAELAALVKPAPNTIPRGSSVAATGESAGAGDAAATSDKSEPSHG